jgi:hypothetical protein
MEPSGALENTPKIHVWSAKTLVASSGSLPKTIVVMQPAKDRTGHDASLLWKPVPVCLERHRQGPGQSRDAWAQGHVRATGVIVLRPLVQETP